VPPLSIKGRYAVTQDNIVKFAEPCAFEDQRYAQLQLFAPSERKS
jgi:hypothetical protein